MNWSSSLVVNTTSQTIKPSAEDAPIFLTAKEAAALLRLSEITLGRWRIEGCGPAYLKFGRRVVYDRADIVAWAESQKRRSTSEQKEN
jgi:hypothetical protein